MTESEEIQPEGTTAIDNASTAKDPLTAGPGAASAKHEVPLVEQKPAGEVAPSNRKRNLVLFAFVALGWFIIDAASKALFDAEYQPNQVITDPILGIFQFRLVHNTGAAWGMFGDSTFFLGIMSSVVCILLLVYLFYFSPRASIGEVIGLALVFAGGIGNAINRFTLGYVVDFIEPTFIDFPVFNIADIGVTCGFIIFLVSFLFFNKEGITKQDDGSKTPSSIQGPLPASGQSADKTASIPVAVPSETEPAPKTGDQDGAGSVDHTEEEG